MIIQDSNQKRVRNWPRHANHVVALSLSLLTTSCPISGRTEKQEQSCSRTMRKQTGNELKCNHTVVRLEQQEAGVARARRRSTPDPGSNPSPDALRH